MAVMPRHASAVALLPPPAPKVSPPDAPPSPFLSRKGLASMLPGSPSGSSRSSRSPLPTQAQRGPPRPLNWATGGAKDVSQLSTHSPRAARQRRMPGSPARYHGRRALQRRRPQRPRRRRQQREGCCRGPSCREGPRVLAAAAAVSSVGCFRVAIEIPWPSQRRWQAHAGHSRSRSGHSAQRVR
eukprot:364863-Chlamydomonas_euryale.AAC.5